MKITKQAESEESTFPELDVREEPQKLKAVSVHRKRKCIREPVRGRRVALVSGSALRALNVGRERPKPLIRVEPRGSRLLRRKHPRLFCATANEASMREQRAMRESEVKCFFSTVSERKLKSSESGIPPFTPPLRCFYIPVSRPCCTIGWLTSSTREDIISGQGGFPSAPRERPA